MSHQRSQKLVTGKPLVRHNVATLLAYFFCQMSKSESWVVDCDVYIQHGSPPPDLPLPSSAPGSVTSPHHTMPLPGFSMNQATPCMSSSSHHSTISPMLPVFSLALPPTFHNTAATSISTPQNNRVTMMVGDVFGPSRQPTISRHRSLPA